MVRSRLLVLRKGEKAHLRAWRLPNKRTAQLIARLGCDGRLRYDAGGADDSFSVFEALRSLRGSIDQPLTSLPADRPVWRYHQTTGVDTWRLQRCGSRRDGFVGGDR